MTNEQRAAYLKALLNERHGYVTYGNDAGVADIDAELGRIGHAASPPAERAVKRGPGRPPKRTEL